MWASTKKDKESEKMDKGEGWVEERVGIFIVPQHERNSLAQLGLVIFVS
jgi:hypothetical protein